jgi:hypothetical protein
MRDGLRALVFMGKAWMVELRCCANLGCELRIVSRAGGDDNSLTLDALSASVIARRVRELADLVGNGL